jgi:hypothetical protein
MFTVKENKSHFSKLEQELRERMKAKKAAKAKPATTEENVDEPSTSNSSRPVTPPIVMVEDDTPPEDNPDSPGTPNSEMDRLLNGDEPRSPVKSPELRRARENGIVDDDDDKDSLDEMFSQPIRASSSSKKVKKKKRTPKMSSDSEDDLWEHDLLLEKPKRNSQVESQPLRRSSRKRLRDSAD